ncbi:MAG: hypothetical protein H6970_03315 [Gammaproteobacteria bacterium]|nr:hypothetical protein [Gammaproteobacteria bacterium]MCP5424087.1 hypothetical protein [Gammaproteobacteria bacterium]MCP5459482.1 hypothetical protein [Gammaproteobacteria bacterium]
MKHDASKADLLVLVSEDKALDIEYHIAKARKERDGYIAEAIVRGVRQLAGLFGKSHDKPAQEVPSNSAANRPCQTRGSLVIGLFDQRPFIVAGF